jgi:hypothetical protein
VTETEIETRPAVVVPEGVQMPIVPGEDFNTLAGELNGQTLSRELINTKGDLRGVPMILTSFTFRPGKTQEKGKMGDYVSVEAVTYDNRRVVFNDSSTGIRRQVVAWLTAQGNVEVPDVKGKTGEPDYDRPFQYWKSETVKGGTFKGQTGQEHLRIEALPGGEPIRFLARHGLRESTYPTPGATNLKDTSTTYYLD